MHSNPRSKSFCSWRLLPGVLLLAPALAAQTTTAPHVISVQSPPEVAARRGSEVEIPLRVTIRSGYHINSNAPADQYLIPTALTWNSGPLALKGVAYPKAESVQYEFSEKPLLVYSGTVTLASRFTVAPDAPKGPATVSGKLRYQACTDKACLPPRTLDLSVAVRLD